MISRLVERLLKLPAPATRRLTVQRDLRVPMADGAELLADHWAPRTGGAGLPTAVLRSPYGRRGVFGAILARPLAERGFQVLIQSTRGGFGSGGPFDPLRQEREDGLATLNWVVKQPWFGDAIVLTGPSYLGYVQWAVADRLPPQVKAMVPHVTESGLTLEFLREDGLSLETPFGWGVQVATQERRFALLRQRRQAKKVQQALNTLPLAQADVVAIGYRSDYIQDVLAHPETSPRWAALDHRDRVADVTVPVSSVGGWYDIFLPGQLRDFRTLQDAGRRPRLTVGPWTHAGDLLTGAGVSIRETLEFGLAHARGEEPPPRAPVRLFVMGEEAWRDFASWPPEGYAPQRFHLQAGGTLATDVPGESAPDRYRYDPADPTPAAGGVRMAPDAGRVDNAALEARADVLTYTTDVLGEDVEVIGDVSAEIWFRSSLRFADVFVRLCDVDPDGRSVNVCDGLTSLRDAAEPAAVTVRLWPTAHRFRRGHRIRVQVSSGAFPRYARNPGTGEPHATAVTLRAADQEVHHDPAHASAIVLPVRDFRE
ncbi:CocE/NonD family hydrolase [Amycolatopsis sp. NPDC051716]|uniref:CocE/NonD family hydrolase n=1 Tax=Amycolatopsis sp. NPDC051716 TaxID=3155804 RepID=UPI0034412B60